MTKDEKKQVVGMMIEYFQRVLTVKLIDIWMSTKMNDSKFLYLLSIGKINFYCPLNLSFLVNLVNNTY